MEGYEATIKFDADTTLQFCRAHSVLYAMREMVEDRGVG